MVVANSFNNIQVRGIGGGGGALVVATRTDNGNPAVFADVAARDTYTATADGTTDANRINVGNADFAREVFAVGTLSAGDVTSITAAYIRLNNSWVAVATNLVGQKGDAGAQGNPGADGADAALPVGATDGQLVSIKSNALALASVFETDDELNVQKAQIQIGLSTLGPLGDIVRLTSPINNREFIPAGTEVEAGGTSDLRYIELGASADLPAGAQQTNDTESQAVAAGNSMEFVSVGAAGVNHIAEKFTIRTTTASTIRLQIFFGSVENMANLIVDQVYTTNAGGDTELAFNTGPHFEDGVSYFIKYTAITDVTILGDTISAEFIPYSITSGRSYTQITQGPTEIRALSSALLSNGRHSGITVTPQLGENPPRIDLAVTGVTPPVVTGASVSNFTIDIPSVVALNTDLNVSTRITFDTQQTSDIGSLLLEVTTGDDKVITVPSVDGSHNADIVLSGISTASAGTLTFRITGTTTGGASIMSNTQTITVRDTQNNEQFYYWAATTTNYATQSLTDPGVTAVDVTQPGTQVEVELSVPNGSFINFIYPSNRTITSILEKPLNDEALSEFPETTNVRTIDTQAFNGRTHQNNSGFDGTYRATVTF